MDQIAINATIERNPMTMQNCHMVGIRCVEGVHVVKCTHDKNLVGKTISRVEWDRMPVYNVTQGIPYHAVLQDVTRISTEEK